MKAIIGIIGIMLVSVVPVWGAEYSAPPLQQPAGATRVYTQWELHMRQVYRSDSDINREYGDAGSSGASSGSDSGGNDGGTGGTGK